MLLLIKLSDRNLWLLPHQQNPLCSGETVYSRASGELWRALEKQTFLWRLWRNRPSSRASGETDFPLEPPENILQAMFSTLSAPGCSRGKPASIT